MNKTAAIRIAKKYILKVKSAGIPVEGAYIFGSTIKGTTHKGSDIDICVISSLFGKDRIDERVRLMNIGENDNEIIEPHPYSMEDFNCKYDALANEIRKYGVKIY